MPSTRYWYFAELNERGGARDRFGPFESKRVADQAHRRMADLYREKRLGPVTSSVERFAANVPAWLRSGHATKKSADVGDWWSAGQRWLEKEALKESAAQKRAWVKAGRSPNTFRYNPPQWHRDAVAALGRNDEETFKAIKLGQLGTRGLPPLKRAHATKRDRAAELIANYPAWTSTYSNEDSDRVIGLALRLTDVDREEGRPVPPAGFSKQRLEQAKKVVRDTNRFSPTFQQSRTRRGHATIGSGESYGSVYRKAVRESLRSELDRALAEIQRATHVADRYGKIHAYGSEPEMHAFVQGLGSSVKVRPITAKERKELSLRKRQAYGNP